MSTADKVKVQAFLEDVLAVCKRHGMGISHEDRHGGFEVVRWEDMDRDWFLNAHDFRDGAYGDDEKLPRKPQHYISVERR